MGRADMQSKDIFVGQKVLVQPVHHPGEQAVNLTGKELNSNRQEGSQVVDENYDPTDFLQGLAPGEILSTNPLPMVLQDGTFIKAEPEESSEARLKMTWL